KCFPCNGRSPFAPPPSSRQCSYNLEDSFTNPKQQVEKSCPKIPLCLQSISCYKKPFPERRRRVAGYALRHRAQQYSGQKKNSFCPRLPLPRFPAAKSIFFLPSIPLSFPPL